MRDTIETILHRELADCPEAQAMVKDLTVALRMLEAAGPFRQRDLERTFESFTDSELRSSELVNVQIPGDQVVAIAMQLRCAEILHDIMVAQQRSGT